MLYHLLSPLSEHFILFNLFNYITFRAFLAGILSFTLTFLLIPIFIRKFPQFRSDVREDTPSTHAGKKGTPTAGGIVLAFCIVVSSLALARLDNPLVWISILTIIYMSLLGFLDDYMKLRGYKGLRGRYKLAFQFLLAVSIYLFIEAYYPEEFDTKTQVLFFKNIFIDFSLLYVFFILLVFAGTTNAVNLTDGLDGLAGGSAIPPLITLLVVSYITSHAIISDYLNIWHFPQAGELSVVVSATIGSLIGFLWYNSYPAEIFMGDTGSQMIGGILAIVSILVKQEILLAIAGGVFVMEALSVILQVAYFKYTKRKFGIGRRIFRRSPLHHHFEEKGLPEPKIVVRFWILSLIFSMIALATLKVR